MRIPVAFSITLLLAVSGLAAPIHNARDVAVSGSNSVVQQNKSDIKKDLDTRSSLFGRKKGLSIPAVPVAGKPKPKPQPKPQPKSQPKSQPPKSLESEKTSTIGGIHPLSLSGGKKTSSAAVVKPTPTTASEASTTPAVASTTTPDTVETTAASSVVTTAESATSSASASEPLASVLADGVCPIPKQIGSQTSRECIHSDAIASNSPSVARGYPRRCPVGRMAKWQAEWRNQTPHGRMRQNLSNFTVRFWSRAQILISHFPPKTGELNHYYWKCTVPPPDCSDDGEIENLRQDLNRAIEDEEPARARHRSILNGELVDFIELECVERRVAITVEKDNMDTVGDRVAGSWSIEELMGQ
ncbi:hypothetical protein B0H11DRAFT_1919050 [Mycena galericulata]|nr:hypothetical protein B0H11DRAFT_1919050 [Mycena galericulata]